MRTFTVPDYGEDPSEEFVDALHELEIQWYGDECGVIFKMEGRDLTALPGDTVTIAGPREVYVQKGEKHAQVRERRDSEDGL